MKRFFQMLLLLLLVGSAIAVGYFSPVVDFEKNILFNLVFLAIVLLYHLAIDKLWSRLFIRVLFFFLLSAVLSIVSFYLELANGGLIYVVQLSTCMGFLLILLEIIKKTQPGKLLNKYSILVFLVLLVDAYVISKIVELLLRYNLSMDHLLFGFIFTIIILLLLSAGIISYFISTRKSRKVSFLNGALASFFLGDIIDTFNYLFFIKDPMPAAAFLQSGLFMLGILMLYVYCTYPKSDPIDNANLLR